MDKDDILKLIAETAYNVGFGAKKHMATFDIVLRVPGLIRFFSITIGVYSLVFDSLSSKFLSASLLILGIIGLYISFYNSQKDDYEKAGVKLIQLFNDLKKLYYNAKNADDESLSNISLRLQEIEDEYYSLSISKQILFSDWYAHYKFFWQFQTDWLDEQKRFKLFRDKIPLTFSISILCFAVLIVLWLLIVNEILAVNYFIP